jgi:hypothetical protein
MCLTTTVAGENMQFEVVSKVKGWVAIGFGPSMENTDMIVSYYIPRRRVDGICLFFNAGHNQAG